MTLEGKKILAYAGRVHHVQRLDGIVQALAAAGAEALYVTSDNYLNYDPNTVHLIQAGRMHLHCLDYLPSGSSGSVIAWASQVLKSIDGDIRDFVDPFYLSSSVYEFCETLLAFDQMLDREKPDLVMVLHGANAWGALLAYLCSARMIPCMAFQEGILRNLDQETQGKQSLAAEYVSHLCVWSESSLEAYIEAGVPFSKLAVTGIPHLDPWLKMGLTTRNGKRVAFCPPLVSRYEGDLGKAISQLAEWALNSRVYLSIRLHPFDNEGLVEQVRQGLSHNPYAEVYTGETLNLIRNSDLVISQHSTVAVEALALGVPLVEIDLDGVGILESIPVATSVGAGELNKLNRILDGSLSVESANLRTWRSHNLGELDGKSVERVVDVIGRILNEQV